MKNENEKEVGYDNDNDRGGVLKKKKKVFSFPIYDYQLGTQI